jgi:hypothetical protein
MKAEHKFNKGKGKGTDVRGSSGGREVGMNKEEYENHRNEPPTGPPTVSYLSVSRQSSW